MLPILLSIVLQLSVVQNFVVSKASEELSKIAKTNISIGHIALDFFTSARLSDIYIEDYRGDTMIFAKELKVSINGINFITGKISLGSSTLTGGQVNLFKDSLAVMNITQIFDNFKPKVTPVDSPNFRLTATELNVLRTRFTMVDQTAPPDTPQAINFKQLQFENIDFQANDISVFNHNIWLRINHISFKERSGLQIDHLSSKRCGVDSSGMYYADVVVETSSSALHLDSINFLTVNKSWYDWNDFENKMIISAHIEQSELSTSTLGHITGLHTTYGRNIEIGEARLWGTVADMRGYVERAELSGSTLSADFVITGLPKVDSTHFCLNIHKLTTSGSSIDRILHTFTGDTLDRSVTEIINRAGALNISALLDGTLSQFEGSAAIVSEAGSIRTRAKIRPSTHVQTRNISGYLTVSGLDAGLVLGVKKLGRTSLKADFDILLQPKSPVTLRAKASIDTLHYGTYDFQSIVVDGQIHNRTFDGKIECADSNFHFVANGKLDMASTRPKYLFDMTLDRANLFLIGLNKRDSVSLLTASLRAQGEGATLDEFNGRAAIENILYINHLDTIQAGSILIKSLAEPKYRELDIGSPFVDINLRGRNSFSQIWQYFSHSLQRFLPSFPEASSIVGQEDWSRSISKQKIKRETSFPFTDGYYQLTVDVKEANNVASIFIPSFEIAQGSTLNFFFNPYLDQFTLRVRSDFLGSNDFLAENLSVDSRNHTDSLSFFATADYLTVGSLELPNCSVIGGICNNIITLGARFHQPDNRYSVLVNTTTSFTRSAQGLPQMRVDIHPTALILDSIQWNLSASSITTDTNSIKVDNFSVYNKESLISLSGTMGKTESDTLTLRLKNGDISPATMLISNLGYNISGNANGSIQFISLLKDMELLANIDFTKIKLSDFPLIDSELRSSLDRKKRRINFAIRAKTSTQSTDRAPLTGFYDLSDKQYGADIHFDSFDMALIEPMMQGILTETSGRAKVDLSLRGNGDNPSLNGTVEIGNYSVMLDFTKARYNVPQAMVKVNDCNFSLAPTPINDGKQGRGEISAKLSSQYFKNLTFDIGVQFTDLLALNTTMVDNSSFYGRAYGTGHITIKGSETKTAIDIVAQTALNSEITLPLSGASTIEEAGFIRFVNKAHTDSLKTSDRRRSRSLSGPLDRRKATNELDIQLNIHVLPNALAQIELDAKVGDIIKGRGEGRLLMHINPHQDIFTMNGPIEITQGTYLFTLQTIFNKRFTVASGSQLLWVGPPTNPDVNLTALYKVKTSLAPLMGNTGNETTSTIDCGINLSGKLLTPNIRFSITAPSADPETQNFIRNAINTEESMSMQFLSLILSNTFMPDMGTASIGTMGGSMVGVTGLEFLSNQLSNLISSERVNVRFGYRPQSTSTSDEFYAGVGADLVADVLKLEVDGNYNTQNNAATVRNNPFTIDAYLTWNINKRGTLKLKGFTRTIDRFDETQGLQESGVGVYFKQDFNNLVDLKARLKANYGIDSVAIARRKAERELRRTQKDQTQKSRPKSDSTTSIQQP